MADRRLAWAAAPGMNLRAYLLGPVLALALVPSNVVAAAIPLLQREWDASAAALGWVFAAYQVGYVLSVLVLLPLTDRIPAGRVIAGSAIATSAAFILFPILAQDVWSAAALRLLAGLGLAGIYMPGVRVVAQAAAPVAAGLVLDLGFGWIGAFAMAGAVGIALALPLLPLTHTSARGAVQT